MHQCPHCAKKHMLGKFLKKHKEVRTIIIATGVILFWRGCWNLMDFYIFPDNKLLSNIFTIILGIILLWIDDLELGSLEE